MNNLLAVGTSVTGDQMGGAALQAIIGFLIVVLGIVILIAILTLVGYIMTRVNNKESDKTKASNAQKTKNEMPVVKKQAQEEISSEVSPEVKVAIIAAIMAYYNQEKPKAEFTVKRIKRI